MGSLLGFKDIRSCDVTVIDETVVCCCCFEQSYGGGIYRSSACTSSVYDLTHAVLVVGYGVHGNDSYWLIQNRCVHMTVPGDCLQTYVGLILNFTA